MIAVADPDFDEPGGELVDGAEQLGIGEPREAARGIPDGRGAIRSMGAARAEVFDDSAGHD